MLRTRATDPDRTGFTLGLLRDLRALERMLSEGLIEEGVTRVGAEQELVLVGPDRRPALVAPAVLEALDDSHFGTELALFNVEINVPPVEAGADTLSRLESSLSGMVERVQQVAERCGADVALTGILPCLAQSDLTLAAMTPMDRYRRLNEATMALANGSILLHVLGTDELRVEHDSVMLEACNTSFQVHLQVGAENFAPTYNAAQLVLAPVLAVAANSPFLFGKRLWAETRIAVFRQSIDTRRSSPALRELAPRVRFGDDWVRGSVTTLFEEDVVRYRTLITGEPGEDPLAVLDEGGIPRLGCLQLHNSTVYRWNRPCYGITNGKPHLRIECRALPAGPTVVDEVANAAFWLGLAVAIPARYGDVADRLEFEEVKSNFFAAARRGLDSSFTWLDGETVQARDLVRDQLVPLAADGLRILGIGEEDALRFLGVISERVERNLNGARWLQRSARQLAGSIGSSRPERCAALTSALISRQRTGRPVHEWELARIEEGRGAMGPTVEEYMTTALLTVNEDELVDLAAFIMDRHRTRQILVEDDDFRLTGLISYRSLLRLLASGRLQQLGGSVPVREVMTPDPVTVPPNTSVIDAIRIMRENGVSCLPVLQDGKLVGILSESDFMPIAAELLRARFGGGERGDAG